MKSKIIITFLLTALFTTLDAKSSYADWHYGNYVSKAHLLYIFNKVKRTSNVSQKALAKTFYYYEHNRYRQHLARDFIAIADYTKVATQKRLYIINLHTGEVLRYLVAHGKNSGAKGGRVWRSSNARGSNMTPYGFFKVGFKEGKTVKQRHAYLPIEGLEWKNRNARKREILLHTAPYVSKSGRSNGCFAILPQDRWAVFSRLKSALLYSYTGR